VVVYKTGNCSNISNNCSSGTDGFGIVMESKNRFECFGVVLGVDF
jgi:hypothetical protein